MPERDALQSRGVHKTTSVIKEVRRDVYRKNSKDTKWMVRPVGDIVGREVLHHSSFRPKLRSQSNFRQGRCSRIVVMTAMLAGNRVITSWWMVGSTRADSDEETGGRKADGPDGEFEDEMKKLWKMCAELRGSHDLQTRE